MGLNEALGLKQNRLLKEEVDAENAKTNETVLSSEDGDPSSGGPKRRHSRV